MRGALFQRGFTLIELLIVVMLIAIMGSLFLSSPGAGFGFRVRGAARVVGNELEYTAQRAIATGAGHRWELDLDRQVFRVLRSREISEAPSQELPTHSGLLELAPPQSYHEYEPLDDRSGEWRWLDDAEVQIDEIVIAGEAFQEGTVGIHFASDGGADPTELWLLDENGQEMQIRVMPFTGEVSIREVPRE